MRLKRTSCFMHHFSMMRWQLHWSPPFPKTSKVVVFSCPTRCPESFGWGLYNNTISSSFAFVLKETPTEPYSKSIKQAEISKYWETSARNAKKSRNGKNVEMYEKNPKAGNNNCRHSIFKPLVALCAWAAKKKIQQLFPFSPFLCFPSNIASRSSFPKRLRFSIIFTFNFFLLLLEFEFVREPQQHSKKCIL